jgi:hypothetical protein
VFFNWVDGYTIPKCLCFYLLFTLNVTKALVGRAGTNPSTTLYIKMRRRLCRLSSSVSSYSSFLKIKAKTFGDCVTINPIEKHKTNNSKCLNIPSSRTAQFQNSFFVDTAIRWNHLPDTVVFCQANKRERSKWES